MTRIQLISRFLTTCLLLFPFGQECGAATPRENAIAAVAVARARVLLADKRAELDDSPEHFVSTTTRLAPEDSPSSRPANTDSNKRVTLAPMRMEIPAGAAPISPPTPRAQLMVEFVEGCRPCQRLKNEMQELLTPKGWTIGEDDNSLIRFAKGTADTTYPRITLYQSGEMADRWYGYQDPGYLSQRLRAAWDTAKDRPQATTHTGPAGTIHARQQIRQGIAYLRKYVGDGNTVNLIWDRSEAKLNLLSESQWEAKALWGTTGRIQIDAPNAVNLPVKSLSMGYQLIGRDVKLIPEPFVVIGLADLLGPGNNVAAGSAPQPVQIAVLDDSLLLYSVVQMLQAVFELLHPSADFVIPDQVSGNITLIHEAIRINFEQAPSVCLKWLFTFNLQVKQIVVTDSNVHIDFTGSRWIKSRDFDVK